LQVPPRIVELRTKILKKNDDLARSMREEFARAGVFVVNVVSGPGAGKTELLTRTLCEFSVAARAGADGEWSGQSYRAAAVVGDLATENDARRLATSGSPVKQILTGTMCHLEADMVRGAIADWNLAELDLLFIENVGNLVCPSSWDLGEDLRVLVCSVTEGEDKPLKYPTLINSADVVVISKLDLVAALDFDLSLLRKNIELVRPGVPVLELSAKTGQGLGAWSDYLHRLIGEKCGALATPEP
jgi:hydrogenase nickel incorporation protein HypB